MCVHNGGQESGSVYNRDSCSFSVVLSHSTAQILCHNSVYGITFNSSVLLASTCAKMVRL